MAVVTLHDEPRRIQWETETAERRWAHYEKCEGVTRRHRRAMKALEPQTVRAETPTLEEYRKALDAHSETLSALKDIARRLPRGADRGHAVRLAVQAGMRKSEAARLMGVSRQRVGEMLNTDEIPF